MLLSQVACTATITGEDQYAFYDPDLVQYVASRGDFPVLVIANPFGAGSDEALLAGMHLPGFYPPAPFKATTAQAREDGHLVLVFNPIHAATGHGICTAPATQTAPAAGAANTLRLHATFCYGRDVVSEAVLEMPRPTGLDGPGLGVALSQLLSALLPFRNRDHGDCGSTSGGFC
ncbi:MAG: hypothetical protein O2967_14300 [Proteobacteria bacterium]|nr:hypothetical protein [Pseudomonadota bacterium]